MTYLTKRVKFANSLQDRLVRGIIGRRDDGKTNCARLLNVGVRNLGNHGDIRLGYTLGGCLDEARDIDQRQLRSIWTLYLDAECVLREGATGFGNAHHLHGVVHNGG